MSDTHQSHNQSPSTRENQQELDEMLIEKRMQEIGYKLVVISGKGGVGKSTVAANLAIALA